jgi:hypothetical protein
MSARSEIVRESNSSQWNKPYRMVELSGGSDGDCTVTYDFSSLKLHEQQEIIDPMPLAPHPKSQGLYSVLRTQILESQWEEVAQRHGSGQSLRQLARCYGVSHEALRQVLRRKAHCLVVGL